MTARPWLAAVAVVLTFTADVFAQVDQGRIAGSVRDQTGAFASGTAVKVKNERTGDERSTVTNDQGTFQVTSLKPSSYTIRVERAGFAPIEYTGMNLALGQLLTLDFELKPAGVQEAVTVVGTAPVLDLSSARIGVNVSTREVEELPVNGRQLSQLLLQAPGSQNAGTGTWYDIRFSGRAVEQNAARYDGIDGGAIISAAPGNLNGEIATPFKLQASLENVQEFRVESSSYPAEYGTGSGGQVSVLTKSGANLFHGSGFEYLRNQRFDAQVRCRRRSHSRTPAAGFTGSQSLHAQRDQSNHGCGDESESGERRHHHPAVLESAARCIREHRRCAESVRGD